MSAVAERKPLPMPSRNGGSRLVVQPSLKIGRPGDKYEQEAESVANHVVMSPSNAAPAMAMSPAPSSEATFQMQAEKEEETLQMAALSSGISMLQLSSIEEEEAIQLSPDGSTVASPQISSQITQSKGSGQALPAPVQAEMGQKIGADFSGVNIHTGPKATGMSNALGAQAFTHGSDIYFNAGKLNPQSQEGKKLLAHELTHVVQQNGGTNIGIKRTATPIRLQPISTQKINLVQRQEEEQVPAQASRAIQVPWLGSVVGSLVHFFWPLARARNRDDVLANVERTLAHDDLHFTFSQVEHEETSSVSYENLSIIRFEELMHQHRRESWTILPNLADLLLTNLGLGWDEYATAEMIRPHLEPLLTVSLEGILSMDSDHTPPATLEFPGESSPEDVMLVRRFVAEILDGRVPEDTGAEEAVILSSMDIDAIRELYEEAEEDREVLFEILRSGERGERDRPPSVDDLIASARAWRRVQETAELLDEDLGERDPDAQEPIVPRPVEGQIILPHEAITVGMEIPVQFQVTNPVDAFRVPHVHIRWSALRRRSGRIETVDTDNTSYIEVRSHGILNERIFEVEFEQAGTYEIHAIVNHNFYTPNAFIQELVVAPVNEVLDQLRSEGDADFGDSGTRPVNADYDFDSLSDIGDYDEGYRYYGELSEERFSARTGSFEESYKSIDQDLEHLRGLVEHYRQTQTESGQDNRDLIDWAEARIGRLTTTREQLSSFAGGVGSLSIAVRAYYASQTAGVPHRQLEVVGWFNHQSSNGHDLYLGHLLDHTGIAGSNNLHFQSIESSYEDMVEELFVELSEDYPGGEMSVSFQLFEGSQGTNRLVTFQRTTETLGGEIAEVAFSGPVGTAVNVVAAVLTVFPPTTGIGIALGLTYNSLATAYDIGQAYESDTLRPSHAVDVGLVFLDILPVIGKGIRGFTAAGRTSRAIETASGTYRVLSVSGRVAEYGGELYMFSEAALDQIRDIHDRQITQLAEIQQRIDTLSSQGAPSQVVAIEQRRASHLQQQIRQTTANTLASLAADQAISLVTPAAARHMAAAHPRTHQGRPETSPTDLDFDPSLPSPRRDVDVDTARDSESNPSDSEPLRREDGHLENTTRADVLPGRFMSAGRPVRVERTKRPGHGVRVRYETDARGMITRVWIEAGRDATRTHLDQHATTVRLMQRYQGISGLLRVYVTRMQNIITRYTRLTNGPELLPGSRAFEAQAEMMKLPDIIRQRASQLSDSSLSNLERAEIMAEIERLELDLRRHMDTFERLDMEMGAGYVAAEHQPRSNQPALDAGYPPLSEAPGHYYVVTPNGGFALRRFVGSGDPPKRIEWENGIPVVRDRPPTTVIHEPLESLNPGETRIYTGPSGTTATATRRIYDRAIVIISRVGPGRGRLGYERAMFLGVEVGLTGWERSHSQGQGTGHESSFGILYAPGEVNQGYQGRGIEQHIRDLFQQIDPNIQLILTTETVAHPGTSRLQNITYRIDAVGLDGMQTRLAEARIDVEDARVNPRVEASVQRYSDLDQFLSGTEGRLPGTDPASSHPETLETITVPLPQEAHAISTELQNLLERTDLGVYHSVLSDALQRLHENPTEEVIANAHEALETAQSTLR